MVFQPLIDFIMEFKESPGYKLGDSKVLTTPFVDDFNLLSWHLSKHQKLMLEVQKKAQSMGLTFKPSKCRSLSIKSGKVAGDCKFYLMDGNGEKIFLKTMEDDLHKFLRSTITGQPQQYRNPRRIQSGRLHSLHSSFTTVSLYSS